MRFGACVRTLSLLAALACLGCGGDNLSLCEDCPTPTVTPTPTPTSTAPTPTPTATSAPPNGDAARPPTPHPPQHPSG